MCVCDQRMSPASDKYQEFKWTPKWMDRVSSPRPTFFGSIVYFQHQGVCYGILWLTLKDTPWIYPPKNLYEQLILPTYNKFTNSCAIQLFPSVSSVNNICFLQISQRGAGESPNSKMPIFTKQGHFLLYPCLKIELNRVFAFLVGRVLLLEVHSYTPTFYLCPFEHFTWPSLEIL